MLSRAVVAVAALLLSACSVRLSLDLARQPGPDALRAALAAYDRALDLYCGLGQLTATQCDRQRAALARARTDAAAVGALEREASDVDPLIARHLRTLAAALREARRGT